MFLKYFVIQNFDHLVQGHSGSNSSNASNRHPGVSYRHSILTLAISLMGFEVIADIIYISQKIMVRHIRYQNTYGQTGISDWPNGHLRLQNLISCPDWNFKYLAILIKKNVNKIPQKKHLPMHNMCMLFKLTGTSVMIWSYWFILLKFKKFRNHYR